MSKEKKPSFDAADLKAALKQHERERLKAELEQLEARTGKRTAKIRLLYWVGAAAAAAAIVLLIVFLGLPRFAPSPGDLFVQYFEPAPNVLAPGERGEAGRDDLQNAFSLYESRQYGAALPMLDSLNRVDDPGLDFYEANMLLAEGRAEEAIPLLLPLAGQASDFGRSASWYLALAYLRLSDIENAKKHLQAMAGDDEHPYQHESKRILKKLRGGS